MKKFFLVVMIIASWSTSFSQTVKVKKEKSTVKGESLEGYSVDLEGTPEEVSAAFFKFTKTLGKARKSDIITITEPNINGLSSEEPIYGVTSSKDKITTAWIGFNPEKFQGSDLTKLNNELEKAVRDFGIKYYRDKIQVQIDESLAATASVERQKQRLVNENKSLTTKTEDNKREKVQLQKAIEQNRLDSITLVQKLALNKKAQDSVAVAAEQIKKVLESQKAKQQKVN